MKAKLEPGLLYRPILLQNSLSLAKTSKGWFLDDHKLWKRVLLMHLIDIRSEKSSLLLI